MEFQVYDIAVIPVIVALVQLSKQFGAGPKIQPLVALLLGIGAGFIYISPDDWKAALFQGIVMGLAAVGLWSGTKNTIEKRE